MFLGMNTMVIPETQIASEEEVSRIADKWADWLSTVEIPNAILKRNIEAGKDLRLSVFRIYEVAMNLGKITKKQFTDVSEGFYAVVEQMSITAFKLGLEFGSELGTKQITDSLIREKARKALPYFKRMSQSFGEWLLVASLAGVPEDEMSELGSIVGKESLKVMVSCFKDGLLFYNEQREDEVDKPDNTGYFLNTLKTQAGFKWTLNFFMSARDKVARSEWNEEQVFNQFKQKLIEAKPTGFMGTPIDPKSIDWFKLYNECKKLTSPSETEKKSLTEEMKARGLDSKNFAWDLNLTYSNSVTVPFTNRTIEEVTLPKENQHKCMYCSKPVKAASVYCTHCGRAIGIPLEDLKSTVPTYHPQSPPPPRSDYPLEYTEGEDKNIGKEKPKPISRVALNGAIIMGIVHGIVDFLNTYNAPYYPDKTELMDFALRSACLFTAPMMFVVWFIVLFVIIGVLRGIKRI